MCTIYISSIFFSVFSFLALYFAYFFHLIFHGVRLVQLLPIYCFFLRCFLWLFFQIETLNFFNAFGSILTFSSSYFLNSFRRVKNDFTLKSISSSWDIFARKLIVRDFSVCLLQDFNMSCCYKYYFEMLEFINLNCFVVFLPKLAWHLKTSLSFLKISPVDNSSIRRLIICSVRLSNFVFVSQHKMRPNSFLLYRLCNHFALKPFNLIVSMKMVPLCEIQYKNKSNYPDCSMSSGNVGGYRKKLSLTLEAKPNLSNEFISITLLMVFKYSFNDAYKPLKKQAYWTAASDSIFGILFDWNANVWRLLVYLFRNLFYNWALEFIA